jgi:4-diphosphocytidyl-2-C-methyl-D-erythritol kinase
MIRLRAHAKLNLTLRVGAVGPQGYHPLATVFQTIGLCDLLYARRAVAEAPLLTLVVDGEELPADNTVTRAVELFAEAARLAGAEPVPVEFRLVKRIPSGAGLGGGSSDAVAALAACARLWDVDFRWIAEDRPLHTIAARIGADVPFFLSGGTASGRGWGGFFARLPPIVPPGVTVAMPAARVATAAAYAAFDRDGEPSWLPADTGYEPLLSGEWMGNDLAAVVAELYPQVEATRRHLEQAGATMALMTGSGSASFGTFAQRRAAAAAARSLRAKGVWATSSACVSHEQHLRGLLGERANLTLGGV